jgi:hypothetical protein
VDNDYVDSGITKLDLCTLSLVGHLLVASSCSSPL